MDYTELIESRKQGNCLDVPMRVAAERLQAEIKKLYEQRDGYGDLLGSANHDVEQLTKYADGLEAKIGDMTERLGTIKELSDMYIPLIGTEKEAPWVRTMMSINGQAEQALKGR
jgi:hypothetical protein